MDVFVNEDGVFCVNGYELKNTMIDGKRFYSLTHFRELTKEEGITDVNTILRRKDFLEEVEHVCGVKIRRNPNIVGSLKNANLYCTFGRRDETQVFCLDKLFITILCELDKKSKWDAIANFCDLYCC